MSENGIGFNISKDNKLTAVTFNIAAEDVMDLQVNEDGGVSLKITPTAATKISRLLGMGRQHLPSCGGGKG